MPPASNVASASTAEIARERILIDRQLNQIREQRASVAAITRRLDQALRKVLVVTVSDRAKDDGRYRPVLVRLLRSL